MSDNYKGSKEWQALNRIWKAVPAAAREGVKEDFRIITEMIKSEPAQVPAKPTPVQAAATSAPVNAAVSVGETNFLAGLSAGARKLALTLLTKEGFNIYDYLMELAVRSKATDAEELFDAYVSQKDIEDDQEEALMEIINVCIRKAAAR